MKGKRISVFIVFTILAVGIVGLYYYFLTHKSEKEEDLTKEKSAVQEMIDMDFEEFYPATVNTVMETYCKLCQAMYNEEYSEDEFKQLLSQYRKLLDDELLAQNPEDTQLSQLSADIGQYKDDKKIIFTYRIVDDASNKETTLDGKNYATTTISMGVKQGSSSVETTVETFILRKDKNDRWKILGWQLKNSTVVEDNTTASPIPSQEAK